MALDAVLGAYAECGQGYILGGPAMSRSAPFRWLRPRDQFYLPENLSERLDRLTARSDVSTTAILTGALRTWLDRETGLLVRRSYEAYLNAVAERVARRAVPAALGRGADRQNADSK